MSFSKTIGIVVGGFGAGIVVIAFLMLYGQAWETPGQYHGVSDASRAPTSNTNCYSFQQGCKNTQTTISQANLENGQYLTGQGISSNQNNP